MTLRLNTLICQAQMDAAKACRHSLDVVVQELMKERGCRASTGGYAPHLVVLPLRSLAHIRPLRNMIICARRANTHDQQERSACCLHGRILKAVSAAVCLKPSDVSMADSDVGLLLHLKTTETRC